MSAFVYILRLRSGGLYVGACNDVGKRYVEHFQGKASRTRKLDPPIAVAYKEECETFVEARRREAQIKRWSRAKKEALVSGDLYTLRELSKSRKR
jgi:putative endonuclease